jgi:hypothetical protein
MARLTDFHRQQQHIYTRVPLPLPPVSSFLDATEPAESLLPAHREWMLARPPSLDSSQMPMVASSAARRRHQLP